MKKSIITLLSISVGSLNLYANNIPYSYADLTFNTYDNADGFTAGGSAQLSEQFYAVGEYSVIGLERNDVDIINLQIGAGFRYEIAPSTDVFTELYFLNSDFDGGNGISIDDSGYLIALGLRKMLKPNIELRGKFEYENVFEGKETNFDFGGMYYFANKFALGASLQTKGNNDLEGFVLRARYIF